MISLLIFSSTLAIQLEDIRFTNQLEQKGGPSLEELKFYKLFTNATDHIIDHTVYLMVGKQRDPSKVSISLFYDAILDFFQDVKEFEYQLYLDKNRERPVNEENQELLTLNDLVSIRLDQLECVTEGLFGYFTYPCFLLQENNQVTFGNTSELFDKKLTLAVTVNGEEAVQPQKFFCSYSNLQYHYHFIKEQYGGLKVIPFRTIIHYKEKHQEVLLLLLASYLHMKLGKDAVSFLGKSDFSFKDLPKWTIKKLRKNPDDPTVVDITVEEGAYPPLSWTYYINVRKIMVICSLFAFFIGVIFLICFFAEEPKKQNEGD